LTFRKPNWLISAQKIKALTELLDDVHKCQKDENRPACFISHCKSILRNLEILLETSLISCDVFVDGINELLENLDDFINQITGLLELVENGLD